MNERIRIRDHLLKVLTDATKERGKRLEWIGTEPAWSIHERNRMLRAVNDLRMVRGKTDVAIDDIKAVERTASGHSDYAGKFALYCTELVLDYP